MRFALAIAFAWLMPAVSSAQTKEAANANALKQGTLKYLYALQDPSGGFYLAAGHPTVDGMPGSPGLIATAAAVRAIKYLGGAIPNEERVKAFVRECYRASAPVHTRGFANRPLKTEGIRFQPTAMGLMAANDLGIPKEEFAIAQNRLMGAQTLEAAQLAAAALESLGRKGTAEAVARWLDLAEEYGQSATVPAKDGGAKRTSLLVILQLRLGAELRSREGVLKILREGQRADGAWSRDPGIGGGAPDPARLNSDLESTYRVMRAFRMLKEKPNDPVKVREFIAKCRNADGGYGVSPGEPSNVQAVYFAAVITHWLDEMQK